MRKIITVSRTSVKTTLPGTRRILRFTHRPKSGTMISQKTSPVNPEPGAPMKLSVIVPVYNEKNTVREIISRLRAVRGISIEIIVVDDCSTDGSRDLYPELRPLVDRIVLHDRNQGKGAALRTGFSQATGDYVIVQDADLEYDPQDFALLLGAVREHNADVVYGSRFRGGNSPHRVLRFWHSLGNRMLTMLSNLFTGLDLTDMETCYKLFRREVIQSIRIEENRFGFEPEITAKLARRKLRISEVGISYAGRSYHEGKKIGFKDGLRAVYCILRYSLLD